MTARASAFTLPEPDSSTSSMKTMPTTTTASGTSRPRSARRRVSWCPNRTAITLRFRIMKNRRRNCGSTESYRRENVPRNTAAGQREVSASYTDHRNLGGDDLSHLPCAGAAADVAGSNIGVRQHFENGLFNGISCLFLAEMVQHHCARPDLGYRIRNPFSGDIRGRAVHWLK